MLSEDNSEKSKNKREVDSKWKQRYKAIKKNIKQSELKYQKVIVAKDREWVEIGWEIGKDQG